MRNIKPIRKQYGVWCCVRACVCVVMWVLWDVGVLVKYTYTAYVDACTLMYYYWH